MCMAAEWGLFGVQRCGVLGCVSPSPPAPLAPGRGEGSGVRGNLSPSGSPFCSSGFSPSSVRQVACQSCFFTTEATEFTEVKG